MSPSVVIFTFELTLELESSPAPAGLHATWAQHGTRSGSDRRQQRMVRHARLTRRRRSRKMSPVPWPGPRGRCRARRVPVGGAPARASARERDRPATCVCVRRM